MVLLILGAVFVGTLGLIVGVFVFVNRRRLAAAAAARARLRPEMQEAARPLLRHDSASDLPFLNRLLAGGIGAELANLAQRAGSSWSPGMVLLAGVALALAGLFLGLVTGNLGLAIVGALLGAVAPLVWLRFKAKRRQQAFETQLPDAIDMLVTSMRAGYSFQAAMRFIGQEMPTPLGPEFARFYDEQRLGIEVRDALLAMQDRVASLDFKMLVTAVLIQRESGGSLGDVLSNIAELMRQRVAVRGQIETLTSEPKLSAKILSALPVVVYFGLLIVNAEYVAPLTNTSVGRIILGGAAISALFGYLILMRLADVDY
ncbi:MAG TPA: type II secretion system F family protein [Gemmatimonadaceae bacterium]|nr:type II secretion system F family protein [Gemmatimonadaceae bacterium]